jgi:hypothetical protein
VGAARLLPGISEIEQPSVNSPALLALRDARRASFRELVRQLVIVDVPENYL